jgi:DNA-binding NtrC family response regulator
LSNLNTKHHCHVSGLHPEVLDHFQNAPWPGNVRQLRNVLERAVIVASQGTILMRHLPPDANAPGSASAASQPTDQDSIQIRVGPQMSEVEQAYIELVLKHTNKNKTRAAQILGVSLRTLHNRVRSVSEEKDEMKSAAANCLV